MGLPSIIATILEHAGLNFVLTNAIPRRAATRFMGWFSRIEQPLVRKLSIAIWRLFCKIDLTEARQTRFKSLHDAFIRELKDGARTIDADPATIVSPCDGIVVGCGRIEGGELLQVKGKRYPLSELLGDAALAEAYRDGCYVTLRLTAAMYHHFHAPHDCRVTGVTHIWGDVWNVNPPTLARVDRLYCKNERAVVKLELAPGGEKMILVAVAAVLVAGIRLHFCDLVLDPRTAIKPIALPHDTFLGKGKEMGWFEHGSTIIVLGSPGMELVRDIEIPRSIKMGMGMMRLSKQPQRAAGAILEQGDI